MTRKTQSWRPGSPCPPQTVLLSIHDILLQHHAIWVLINVPRLTTPLFAERSHTRSTLSIVPKSLPSISSSSSARFPSSPPLLSLAQLQTYTNRQRNLHLCPPLFICSFHPSFLWFLGTIGLFLLSLLPAKWLHLEQKGKHASWRTPLLGQKGLLDRTDQELVDPAAFWKALTPLVVQVQREDTRLRTDVEHALERRCQMRTFVSTRYERTGRREKRTFRASSPPALHL